MVEVDLVCSCLKLNISGFMVLHSFQNTPPPPLLNYSFVFVICYQELFCMKAILTT